VAYVKNNEKLLHDFFNCICLKQLIHCIKNIFQFI
jgi:hypothetical protein